MKKKMVTYFHVLLKMKNTHRPLHLMIFMRKLKYYTLTASGSGSIKFSFLHSLATSTGH